MPSPFPGMNPYLEQPALWPDFYLGFLAILSRQLIPLIRPTYFALIQRYNSGNGPAQEVERIAYLEIRETRSRDLIAVIEVLSPSNKREDRLTYLARREKVLGSAAHLVEIDLLRGGRPMPEADRPPCAYSVLVSHADGRPRAGFWPIGLRDPLPEIPVPLRRPDPPAKVDLQAILHRVYDGSAYEDFIYDGSPDPPLAPDDAAWAAAHVPKPA